VRVALIAGLILGLTGCARNAAPGVSGTPAPADPRLERVVADYVGLYRRETLDQWEKLFLPSFTAANTRPDGTVGVRARDEFIEAQRRYHARVDGLREDLENVRIERQGPLASVWADFVVTDSGKKNRGKLILLIIRAGDEYKIHSLMFAYDR
jgi:hypothetical protein